MGTLGTFEDATSEFDYNDDTFLFNYLNNVPGSQKGWGFFGNTLPTNLVTIARDPTNERSGANALRVEWGSDDTTGPLYLASGRLCGNYPTGGSNDSLPVGFRCSEGDLVTFGVWYELNHSSGGSAWGIRVEFIDEARTTTLDTFDDVGPNSDVATYAQLEASGVAPASTYWCRLSIRITNAAVYDFDDITLSVA